MKERINLTNDEKLAANILGSSDHINFSMAKDVDQMILNEKKEKFNNKIDAGKEALDEQYKRIDEAREKIKENFESLDLMPLYNRIIIKPYEENPFQKLTIENGIITDIGGLNPNIQFNNDTGSYQEREQSIVVADVVEVGPEVKYLKPGDVVFYFKGVPSPIPFFKMGFWTIKEENILAVVGNELYERFKQ